MNEEGLKSDGDDLHDAIEDVDTAGDGGVNVEQAHGDRQGAVDVNEEDAKINEEQVNAIVFSSWLLLVCKVLNLNEASHSGADAEKVDEGVEHFAEILEHSLLTGSASSGAEEDNKVQEGEQEDKAPWHRPHSGVWPVRLGQGGAEVGLPDNRSGGCSPLRSLVLGLSPGVDIVPGVVEHGAAHQRELDDEAEQEGGALLENVLDKVVIVIFVGAVLHVKMLYQIKSMLTMSSSVCRSSLPDAQLLDVLLRAVVIVLCEVDERRVKFELSCLVKGVEGLPDDSPHPDDQVGRHHVHQAQVRDPVCQLDVEPGVHDDGHRL